MGVAHGAAARDAQLPVEVLAIDQRFIEQAVGLERARPRDGRPHLREEAAEKRARQVLALTRMLLGSRGFMVFQIGVRRNQLADHGVQLGVRIQHGEVRTYVSRQEDIVVVEKGDKLARGDAQAGIAPGAASIVSAKIDAAELLGNRLRFRRSAVVADENFELQVRPFDRADAGQRLAQRVRPVARGNGDGNNPWRGGRHQTHSSHLSNLPARTDLKMRSPSNFVTKVRATVPCGRVSSAWA